MVRTIWGDLGTSTLPEVWNGPQFQECRQALIEGRGVGTARSASRACGSSPTTSAPLPGACREGSWSSTRRNWPISVARRRTTARARSKSPLPYFILLDLSSKCNIRCRKCYVYNHQQVQPPVGHMLRPVFDKIAPYLPYAIRVVCTGNGEAVLHPDFHEMMQILGGTKCQISFNTSGNPLTPELSQAVVDLKVYEIIFSIDSIDENMYAYHHRGGSLKRVMEKPGADPPPQAGSAQPAAHSAVVLRGMKSTLPELPRVVRRAAELGFQALYVERLIPADPHMKQCYRDYYAQENLISTPADRQWLREALDEAQKLAVSLGIGLTTGYSAILAQHAAA